MSVTVNEAMKFIDDIKNDFYKLLYDNNDNVQGVDFYGCVNAFDQLVNSGEIDPLLKAYCSYKGDFLSSDREIVAFSLAVHTFANMNIDIAD